MKLEVIINFVDKQLDADTLIKISKVLEQGVDDNFWLFNSSKSCWIWQTFCHLKTRGSLNVILSNSLKKDYINVIDRDSLEDKDLYENFVVSIRSDKSVCFGANIEIVQNASSVFRSNEYHIPHWPQPGLIPRESKDCEIKNISFFGKHDHLEDDFKSEEFLIALQKLGCVLQINENQWNDYSSTDLVLAVRDGHKFYLNCKPVSKLVNSWIAGCPAILSREVAYTEQRRSHLDYFEAATTADVLRIVHKLKQNPDVYENMILNGRQRATDFSVYNITKRWEHFFANYAAARFETWKNAKKHPIRQKFITFTNKFRTRVLGWHATRYPKTKFRLILSYVRIILAIPSFIVILTKRLIS